MEKFTSFIKMIGVAVIVGAGIYIIFTLLLSFSSIAKAIGEWIPAKPTPHDPTPIHEDFVGSDNNDMTEEEMQNSDKITIKPILDEETGEIIDITDPRHPENEDYVGDFQNDPYFKNITKDFYIVEYKNHVVIYRKATDEKGSFKPNISFVKTDKGLVWDGALGVKAKLGTNWITGAHKFDKMQVTLQRDFTEYNIGGQSFGESVASLFKKGLVGAFELFSEQRDNLVSFSNFSSDFVNGFNSANVFTNLFTAKNEELKLKDHIKSYLYNNVVAPYFQDFSDRSSLVNIELATGIENKENKAYILSQLNSFATYLFENSKTDSGESRDVKLDITHYFKGFIPTNLIENFPINNALIEKELNSKYYKIYNNKIIANTSYFVAEKQITERGDVAGKIKEYAEEATVATVPPAIVIEDSITVSEKRITIWLRNRITNTALSAKSNILDRYNNKTISFDEIIEFYNNKSNYIFGEDFIKFEYVKSSFTYFSDIFNYYPEHLDKIKINASVLENDSRTTITITLSSDIDFKEFYENVMTLDREFYNITLNFTDLKGTALLSSSSGLQQSFSTPDIYTLQVKNDHKLRLYIQVAPSAGYVVSNITTFDFNGDDTLRDNDSYQYYVQYRDFTEDFTIVATFKAE